MRRIVRLVIVAAIATASLFVGSAVPAQAVELTRVEVCVNSGFCFQLVNTEVGTPSTGTDASVDVGTSTGTSAEVNVSN